MERKRILILEDDLDYATKIREVLEGAYEVTHVSSVEDFWKVFFPFGFDLMIIDIRISGEDKGLRVLKEIKEQSPGQAVIVLTQYGEKEYFFEAMDLGAHLFLEKQDFSPKIILKLISSILAYLDSEKRATNLAQQLADLMPLEIVGKSKAIQRIKEEIHMAAADGRITVLIRGESGTGKELVARNIHQLGKRKSGNFIALNIAGLPSELLYSELFGYEKGAFTDAKAPKKGRLEEANGGIIFLDEVGDLDEGGQIKLLRLLEERKFTRLGSNREIEINVQFVAATHKPLEKLVQEGKFREDLYYRLRQFEIYIPPLRERTEDIPLLTQHFLKLLQKEGRGKIQKLSSSVMRLFRRYPFPGNVRELKVIIENAAIRATWENSNVIKMSHLPHFLQDTVSHFEEKPSQWNYSFNLARSEIQLVWMAIEEFQCHKKKKLAEILQYPNRYTFMRRIKRNFGRFPELKKMYPYIWELFMKEDHES